jgi:hypothetical protein
MSEQSVGIKLSGWKALAIIPLVVGALGLRVVTITNKKNDANLMREVEFELMTEYFPDDVARLRALYDAGKTDEFTKAVRSTTTTTIDIKSVKASYSIFDFSTKDRDVVVKVVYSLDDASGTRKQGTNYYGFEHSPPINRWKCWGKRSVVNYYLNFI